jgi:hypothetical protein
VRWERAAPGTRVTVPGPLVPYRRIRDGLSSPPTLESEQPADMHLRFQVPAAVLPLKVERARLVARVNAPGRRVTLAGRAGEQVAALHAEDSPLEPVSADITEERLLRLDEGGGLNVNLSLGEAPGGIAGSQKWTIEYIELEVVGVTE